MSYDRASASSFCRQQLARGSTSRGTGKGSYVRFDFNVLPPVLHCIDFDEGGEKTFSSDSACHDRWCLRRLCWWPRSHSTRSEGPSGAWLQPAGADGV